MQFKPINWRGNSVLLFGPHKTSLCCPHIKLKHLYKGLIRLKYFWSSSAAGCMTAQWPMTETQVLAYHVYVYVYLFVGSLWLRGCKKAISSTSSSSTCTGAQTYTHKHKYLHASLQERPLKRGTAFYFSCRAVCLTRDSPSLFLCLQMMKKDQNGQHCCICCFTMPRTSKKEKIRKGEVTGWWLRVTGWMMAWAS